MNRYCSLVLHAHVPWVRHPETPRCLEEDWLFEAVAESYLPLLKMLYQLREEGIPFRLALNLSSTVCNMLRDPLMQRRTDHYLDRTTALAHTVVERGGSDEEKNLARYYISRFDELKTLYRNRWNRDLVSAFSDLQRSGHLELLGCAATHSLLPLLSKVPEASRAQIETGCRYYQECFGMRPRGFWLPECGFAPGLEPMLRESGIQWTLLEPHGVMNASHPPKHGIHRPVRTAWGNHAFIRDADCSAQIWSSDSGYPSDPRYREFYRDIGLEAPMDNLNEYLEESSIRRFTGLKFHRVTGKTEVKELYSPAIAQKAVSEHASHFVESRALQLELLERDGIENPVVLAAFDAELFGHWWFEGVDFLEQVIRLIAQRSDFSLDSPGAILDATGQDLETVEPVSSTWGVNGYYETWLSEENAWIYPHLHQRARKLGRVVEVLRESLDGLPDEMVDHRIRCVRQMTRELMLAQASDWAFLMRNGAAQPYAVKRTQDHLSHFDILWTAFGYDNGDAASTLRHLEALNPIFPNIDWTAYAPAS